LQIVESGSEFYSFLQLINSKDKIPSQTITPDLPYCKLLEKYSILPRGNHPNNPDHSSPHSWRGQARGVPQNVLGAAGQMEHAQQPWAHLCTAPASASSATQSLLHPANQITARGMGFLLCGSGASFAITINQESSTTALCLY
jgi:hypothetical protein